MSGRVACVIPAYNAAATVGAVVRGVRAALPDATIFVIDDGSADDTARVAEEAGAISTRLATNGGKGAALRLGFRQVLAAGCDVVVTVDADGQHDPSFAPALVAGLGGADVVVGVRARRGTRMPVQRRFTNAISSAAVSVCARCWIADAQSGYRAIAAQVLRDVEPVGDRYEFETDFLILAGRRGFRIAGVPVPTIYGRQVQSHFRPVTDTGLVAGRIWQRLSNRAS
jgi:glycosyltransferase involved in cell wall biosynthesis